MRTQVKIIQLIGTLAVLLTILLADAQADGGNSSGEHGTPVVVIDGITFSENIEFPGSAKHADVMKGPNLAAPPQSEGYQQRRIDFAAALLVASIEWAQQNLSISERKRKRRELKRKIVSQEDDLMAFWAKFSEGATQP